MQYTIRCHNKENGYFTREVEGTPVILMEGYTFFVHRTVFEHPRKDVVYMNDYSVSEASCGYTVAMGKTEVEAIEKAEANINSNRERFIGMVANAVALNKTLFHERSEADN